MRALRSRVKTEVSTKVSPQCFFCLFISGAIAALHYSQDTSETEQGSRKQTMTSTQASTMRSQIGAVGKETRKCLRVLLPRPSPPIELDERSGTADARRGTINREGRGVKAIRGLKQK